MLKIVLRNRQRAARVDMRLLRRMIGSLLARELGLVRGELGIHLVEDRTITELNERHLNHRGATDVITFDYQGGNGGHESIAGDVFVCVPEAVRQAPRFQTSWQAELVRYIVHGILHLSGYDDQNAVARRKMKGEENCLLKALGRRFRVGSLGRTIESRRA